MESKLRMAKVSIPENKEDFYFVTFTSGRHEPEEVVENHDIEVEVMVDGSTSLGDVEGIARERAIKHLKALAGQL